MLDSVTPTPAGLLRTLLAISPVGIILLRPLYAGADAGTITDFAWVQLNPAAQQQLRLPECPAESFLTLFPTAREVGVFGFYRDAFLSGQVERRDNLYQFDGLDGYYRLVAQRHEDVLVVNFTDTSDQARTAVEMALRESQADEQEARAQTEAGRQRFYDVLMHLPALVAVYEGPELVYSFTNTTYQRYFPAPARLLGRPLREVLPETEAQGVAARLAQVYRTGEPYYAEELEVWLDFSGGGQRRQQVFLNLLFHPLRDAQGRVHGVLDYSYDVTAQVLARRQVEQLNTELEGRVAGRTREALALQAAVLAAAQRQAAEREAFYQVFEQTAAAVALLRGADHRYEYANAAYRAYLPGRPVVGATIAEVVPEAAAQGFTALLDQVYQTGETYVGAESPFVIFTDGVPRTAYVNFTYQAYREAGEVVGISVFAFDVTELVLARQQVEQLNTQLEERVQARTRELEAARTATERERALLQGLLTQAPVAIALFQGDDVQVAAATTEMAALWGYTPAQVVGRPLLEGVPELRGQGFDDLLRQVLRTRVPVSGTETPAQLLRDGRLQTSYYNFIYQPLYDAEGRVLGVIDVAVDVTGQVLARRQVEQLNQELETRVQERTREALGLQAELLAAARRQVLEREELYQVFEQAPVVVALLRGPEHHWHYRNSAFQRLFPGRVLTGRRYAEAMPEIVAAGLLPELDRMYATGQPYYGTALPVVTTPPDGAAPQLRYFDFSYQPYREDGRIAGIAIFAYDVTGQVLARQEREQQQQLLQAMFEQAPVAIFVVRGEDYVFEVVNPSMGLMLATAPDQVLGRRYFDLLPALEEQGYRELLDQVYQTGREYVAQEQAARLPHHAAGETGYYNFTYVPLREADGRVSGILCVAVDVTAQVVARQQVEQLNQELTLTNQQLTRTNVDLDTFVYTASHDLKTPMTNIEGLALALRETLPAAVQQDELVARLLDLLDKTISRFQFTIAQLTDLSRLQQAHTGPAEPVALAGAIEAVRLDLAADIAAAKAHLTVEVAPELIVSFSPSNLRSIVYNLLSNAVKYRAPDRPALVRVRATLAGPQVQLQVQDNGLGLSEHQQGRLYGLFQRLHDHVEGTGVGLYITKRLVENGGGTIAVESTTGVGTTFTVTFPA